MNKPKVRIRRRRRRSNEFIDLSPTPSIVRSQAAQLWAKIDQDCILETECIPARYDQLLDVTVLELDFAQPAPLGITNNSVITSDKLSFLPIVHSLAQDLLRQHIKNINHEN